MDRTKIPISHGTSFVKYYVVKMNLSGFGPIFSSQQTIIYTATKTDHHMIIFSYMFKWHNYPKCHTHDFGHFLRKIPVSSHHMSSFMVSRSGREVRNLDEVPWRQSDHWTLAEPELPKCWDFFKHWNWSWTKYLEIPWGDFHKNYQNWQILGFVPYTRTAPSNLVCFQCNSLKAKPLAGDLNFA